MFNKLYVIIITNYLEYRHHSLLHGHHPQAYLATIRLLLIDFTQYKSTDKILVASNNDGAQTRFSFSPSFFKTNTLAPIFPFMSLLNNAPTTIYSIWFNFKRFNLGNFPSVVYRKGFLYFLTSTFFPIKVIATKMDHHNSRTEKD